jgi:hypothetical protein
MKIYQAYYKDEQKVHLDPEFTPFDNTANPVVNLHEFYIYTKIYQEAQKTNEDYWGHFSWQWKKKLQAVPASAIIKLIEDNPGYDVYTFNPFPWEVAQVWNVWEQGDWCDMPHMIPLGQRILEAMDVNPLALQAPMGTKHYVQANYFVGNKFFWDGLLAFLHRFVDVCGRLPTEYVDMLNTETGYEPNPTLDYRGFICERLISTFLVINDKKLKIRPFRELAEVRLPPELKKAIVAKDSGIEAKSKDFLYEYLSLRPEPLLDRHDYGKDWIQTCIL